jgi:YVTN family beta-propeller protein
MLLMLPGVARSCLVLAAALLVLSAHAGGIAFLPRGDRIEVFDVSTETALEPIALGQESLHAVHFAPGASRGYAAGTRRIHVIDTLARREIATWNVGATVDFIAVSPSRQLAFVVLTPPVFGEPYQDLLMLSTETGAVIRSIRLEGGIVGDIAFNAAGDLVLVSNAWGHVHVLDGASGTELYRIPLSSPDAIVVHPTLDQAYVTQRTGTLSVLNLRDRALAAVIPVGAAPRHVAINPAGTQVFVSNFNEGTLSVIETSGNRVIATLPVCRTPGGVDVTPDGTSVWVLCTTGTDVISTSSLSHVRSIPAFGRFLKPGKFIGGPDAAVDILPGVLTGLWSNPSEPGWGVHLTQRGDTVFGALFSYDAQGRARWYVVPACKPNMPLACPACVTDAVCTGKVHEMSGPAFFHGFNPAAVSAREAGIAELRFFDADRGHMTMAIDGEHRSVEIRRQLFSTGTVAGTNYSDLWWNPSEPGWGLGVTHRGEVMFLTWFVYDDFGKPAWYVASDCRATPAGKGCQGTLYRTSGPPGPLRPSFATDAVRVSSVGTVQLTFTDDDTGILSFTAEGRSGTEPIKRQLF